MCVRARVCLQGVFLHTTVGTPIWLGGWGEKMDALKFSRTSLSPPLPHFRPPPFRCRFLPKRLEVLIS